MTKEIPTKNVSKFILSVYHKLPRYDCELVQEPWGGEYPDMVKDSSGGYVKIEDVKELISNHFTLNTRETKE